MGSSGAGKTTLMDLLAGRKTAGKIEGEILLNGKPKDDNSFNRIIGYCEQQDLIEMTSTVLESLMFSAKLRLPHDVSDEQKEKFVYEILALLELTHIKDRVVHGGEVHSSLVSLSPGELKLLSIGIELVSNPSILFLDEPTSGLESRAAMMVMKAIRRIASTGRSVICTIHQPSEELFCLFDSLYLLVRGGKTVYFGPLGENASELVHYFETANGEKSPKKPEITNPASWMLEVIGGGAFIKYDDIPDYNKIYEQHDLCKKNLADLEALIESTKQNKLSKYDGHYASSLWRQFVEVTKRGLNAQWRNVSMNFTMIMMLVFLSILFGLIYLKLDDSTFNGVQSKMASIFTTAGFGSVIVGTSSAPVLAKDRSVYYRETAGMIYRSFAYSLSLAVVNLPFLMFTSVVFVVPFYFMIGFRTTAAAFFKFLLGHHLLAMVMDYNGKLLISLTPNVVASKALEGLFMTFIFLFGGLYIRRPNFPIGWQWFYYINPLPKALVALGITQFECVSDPCPTIDIPVGTQIVTMDQATYVSEQILDFTFDFYWKMIGWLVLSLVVYLLFIVRTLHKVRWISR